MPVQQTTMDYIYTGKFEACISNHYRLYTGKGDACIANHYGLYTGKCDACIATTQSTIHW